MLNEFADSFMEHLNELSVDAMWDTSERNIHRIMGACIPHKITNSRHPNDRNMSNIGLTKAGK